MCVWARACLCVSTRRCFWSLCIDQKRKSWVLTLIPFCLSLYSLWPWRGLSFGYTSYTGSPSNSFSVSPNNSFSVVHAQWLGSHTHTDIFSILCGCLVSELGFSHLHTEHSYPGSLLSNTAIRFIRYGRLHKEMRTHSHRQLWVHHQTENKNNTNKGGHRMSW